MVRAVGSSPLARGLRLATHWVVGLDLTPGRDGPRGHPGEPSDTRLAHLPGPDGDLEHLKLEILSIKAITNFQMRLKKYVYLF